MAKGIRPDNNQNIITIDTFRKEASLRSNIAEVKWIGYEKDTIRFSIHNLSRKSIPIYWKDITIIDTHDNIYTCEQF